jgi:hypothetical protein
MKEHLSESLIKKLRAFVDDGSLNRYDKRYNGVVEDNNDPERIGRCKIRVMGLYDGIDTDYLPWALPDFSFVGSIKGSFVVPENGTVVNVYYDDNDIYQPRYFSKTLDLPNLNFQADKNEEYPDSMIFWETENGSFSKFNRKKGEYSLKTHTGVFVKIFESGVIEVSNDATDVGDLTLNLRGNFNISNPFGNINIFTNNLNLSGYGDMNIVNNGTTKIHSLENAELMVNGNCDIVAGGQTKITAKEKCTVEAMSCDVLANEINFDIAAGPRTDILDVDGVPDTAANKKSLFFEMNVGSEEGVPLMSVTPSIKGGPFNTMMFDPLTGAIHQGRSVKGASFIKTVDPIKEAELIRQTAIIKAEQAKAVSDKTIEITKKYNSVTEQTKLLVSGPAAVAFTQKKKAEEIASSIESINKEYAVKIEDLKNLYGNNIKTPVFGTNIDPATPQGKSFIHKTKIPAAEALAALDPTNKTSYFDLIGSSGGFVNDEEEG